MVQYHTTKKTLKKKLLKGKQKLKKRQNRKFGLKKPVWQHCLICIVVLGHAKVWQVAEGKDMFPQYGWVFETKFSNQGTFFGRYSLDMDGPTSIHPLKSCTSRAKGTLQTSTHHTPIASRVFYKDLEDSFG